MQCCDDGAEAREEASEAFPSSVWGPTCDGIDKVEEGVRLPLLDVGSWLVYRDTGGYTLAFACTFNGVPIPRVHSVVSTDTWYVCVSSK